MNKQIKELAVKAGIISAEYNGFDSTVLTTSQRKFAELIVRECADISDASFHNGSAGYTAILKHFGVEE